MTKNKASSRYALVIFFTLLLFFAVAAAAVYSFQLLTISVNTNAADIDKLQRRLVHSQNNQHDIQVVLERMQKALANLSQPNDWQIEETIYLIHLAQYNLEYQQDVPVAQALLKQVSHLLAQLHKLDLHDIQQDVADAELALKALPKYPVATILLQLNALQNQVGNLPMLQPSLSKKDMAINQGDNTKPEQKATWRNYLYVAMKQLKDLIIIKHYDKPITLLSFSQNRVYITEQLHLLLSQAQWAMLRIDQQALFTESLQSAENWISTYYDQSSSQVQAFQQTLQALISDGKLTVQYPDLAKIEADLTLKIESEQGGDTTP